MVFLSRSRPSFLEFTRSRGSGCGCQDVKGSMGARDAGLGGGGGDKNDDNDDNDKNDNDRNGGSDNDD